MFAAKRRGIGAYLLVVANPGRCYWPEDIGTTSVRWDIAITPPRLDIHLDYYSVQQRSTFRISLDATSCLHAGTLLHDFLKAACDDGRLELAFEGDYRPYTETKRVGFFLRRKLRNLLQGIPSSV